MDPAFLIFALIVRTFALLWPQIILLITLRSIVLLETEVEVRPISEGKNTFLKADLMVAMVDVVVM